MRLSRRRALDYRIGPGFGAWLRQQAGTLFSLMNTVSELTVGIKSSQTHTVCSKKSRLDPCRCNTDME
ncbi:hypothetical protein RRG08_012086 [Elysia crispata]|uniref:Uncharacterized protein n=1 Tax=Elysia crispata TaxID=231223 RepID=A0AAE0YU41_9GAST|nr:hypothetical protein RRG08_012086 [Elysia crispata]